MASTSEENLLQLKGIVPGDHNLLVDGTVHEYAHSVQNLCFTEQDHEAFNALYHEAQQAGLFPDEYAMINAREFFAVFTTVYFNDTTEMSAYGMPRHDGRNQLRIRHPKLYEFIDRIYNAE